MPLRIDSLQFDEWNAEEFARHGVQEREVRQVFDAEDVVFLPNKRGQPSPILMIGPTWGGRFLTVPLASTEIEYVWRPATAWTSSPAELARYRAVRRRK